MKYRVAAILMLSFMALASFAANKRPNVLVIVSDDHRYDLMGHKGCSYMKTPNLDQLAAEGWGRKGVKHRI